MKRSFLAVTGGLLVMASLAVASEASASVTGVFTGRNVNAVLPAGSPSFTGPVGNGATQLTDLLGGATDPYNNYQVASQITSTDISFYNNVTTLGARTVSSLSTSNQLNVTFTNDGSAPVTPVLQSTVTPGGFGIYTMDPTQNPTFSSGKVLIGDINQSPEYSAGANTFQGWSQHDATQPIASATFTFSIASDGVVVDSINGSLTLNPNPVAGGTPMVAVTLKGLGAALGSPPLTNFRLLTPAGGNDAVVYEWDATNIAVPLGGPLAVGASRTLTYSSVVTVTSNADYSPLAGGCFNTCELLAFAGFGDPIGKGGGGSGAIYHLNGLQPGGAGSGISGLSFLGYSLGLPTFDTTTGTLGVPVATQPLASLPLGCTPVIGVPEPGVWALMLAGVGLVGGAQRRRRSTTAVRLGRRFA
ncbi:MAG TPA: PEPxxWA-CTERM sorting domain-containing protein [Caulobacteraceae bacterium]|nr:PEPxxWA-CTERM sorting domain-containing protein [Caulobacteraceae bacterium]